MKNNLLKIFFAVIFLSTSLTSCAKSVQKNVMNLGPDESYFMGLNLLSKGKEKEARVKFNMALKKASPLVARRSAEALCTFGDVQEKVSGAKKLVSLYSDDEALLTACRIFSDNNEIGLVLQTATSVNLKEADDELISLKFRAMEKRNLQGLKDQLKTWYFEKAYSKYHHGFFEEFAASELFSESEKFLITLRDRVYLRDYQGAFEMLKVLDEDFEGEGLLYPQLTEHFASDIGKVYLYGSSDALKSADRLSELAQFYAGTPLEFYWWFYAGRMYDKAKNYTSKVTRSFKKAIECTDNSQKKDNARWYLLRAGLKESVQKSVEDVKNNLTDFADPSYYDDFFDLLAPLLLNQGYCEEIGNLYKMMKGYASKEATAKYAFIYGRLIQEGIYNPTENVLKGLTSEEEMKQALTTACDSATDMYYKVVAAKALGLSKSECEALWTYSRKIVPEEINEEAGKLLYGYAAFGFPEKIYPEWVRLNQCLIPQDSTVSICRFLLKCAENGNGNDDYYPQCLRIASRYANYSPQSVSKELLTYSFPKCYENLITKYAEKNNIEPEVLFALIRSESFFDADVTSSAGAIGLCQLMSFTAEDVAHRLRRQDYDLLDPETNIEFGSWYLGNLIGRLDGNYLDAFYAYNAGITRVRKWKQSSAFGLGLKVIPEDLFLETLPYAETREYGRKLVSAAEMYTWLY